MKTSTKGLKPCAFHFRSLAATTGREKKSQASFKKKKKENRNRTRPGARSAQPAHLSR